VHETVEKLPVPLLVNETVPGGNDFDPESVSDTVAVQVVAWLTTTDAGVQDTLVDVVRSVTASWKPVASALPAWIESLAL
jgi:hypothetical protein